MISVQFFAQEKTTKQKINSNKVYFDEINYTNLMVIKAQRSKLESNLPDYRIVCVIEQISEDLDDNNTSNSFKA
jgi:hypothetical protein